MHDCTVIQCLLSAQLCRQLLDISIGLCYTVFAVTVTSMSINGCNLVYACLDLY